MKELNLVYPEKSDIKFTISKFPDGQQQITIIDTIFTELRNKNSIVNIKARLNNFKDLELIICAVQSLRNLGVKEIHLYTPYFLGSRSDRQFEEGSNNYLKDVICPIINSLKLESVTILDPHSYVLEGCLNNFENINNKQLVQFALFNNYGSSKAKDNIILVSPDAGANHKIYKLAEQIGYKGDIITCSKERDNNGKLTRTVIPVSTIVHKDYIIIDDICDGGATFINIAKILKSRLHKSNRIFLIVTHSIFSKGLGELQQYFDGVYCTNSYQDLQQCEPFVKQFNIF